MYNFYYFFLIWLYFKIYFCSNLNFHLIFINLIPLIENSGSIPASLELIFYFNHIGAPCGGIPTPSSSTHFYRVHRLTSHSTEISWIKLLVYHVTVLRDHQQIFLRPLSKLPTLVCQSCENQQHTCLSNILHSQRFYQSRSRTLGGFPMAWRIRLSLVISCFFELQSDSQITVDSHQLRKFSIQEHEWGLQENAEAVYKIHSWYSSVRKLSSWLFS